MAFLECMTMTNERSELTFDEALTNVLERLWDDEQRAYHAAPPGERSGHIYRSLSVLRRHRERAASDALEMKVAAGIAQAEILGHARYLVDIADPDHGDSDAREARIRASALAVLVLEVDRLARRAKKSRARTAPVAERHALDGTLARLRDVAARLVDADDEGCNLDEELENACEMASRFQELDVALSTGGPFPTAWNEPSVEVVPEGD